MEEELNQSELANNNKISILLALAEGLMQPATKDSVNKFNHLLSVVIKGRKKRNCVHNYIEYVVPFYTEREFLTHFRVRNEVYRELVRRYSTTSFCPKTPTQGGGRLPVQPEKHLLLFLWFVGHQTSSFRDVADRFDIGLRTMHHIITHVSAFICSLASEFIKWPSQEVKLVNKQAFMDKKGFPDVIGCIDGSHIRIDRPDIDPDSYINRKGFFSIQLQCICNADKKFIDVFLGYPGSVHDARVYRNSEIFDTLSNMPASDHILADSAYSLDMWCMTPYKDNGHLNQRQKGYNRIHSFTRVAIEHTFGILKQRFRQLYHLKLRGIHRICQVVKACCVLHNLCDSADLEELGHFLPEDDASTDIVDNTQPTIAKLKRLQISQQLLAQRN